VAQGVANIASPLFGGIPATGAIARTATNPGYVAYFEELVPRLRADGVLLVDNVLWGGAVVDPEADDENTRAIRAFNDHAAADERVDTVMLPIADGLTLCRKRA
jgi:caffeoyl-CoA O-methyltransferase